MFECDDGEEGEGRMDVLHSSMLELKRKRAVIRKELEAGRKAFDRVLQSNRYYMPGKDNVLL